jgi:CheY-like chemotaxis protein
MNDTDDMDHFEENIFQQDDTQGELSEEDRAILRAFEAMDLGSLSSPAGDAPSLPAQRDVPQARIPDTPEVEEILLSPDEMLAIFLGEVEEDLLAMRRSFQQLEQRIAADRLQFLQESDLRGIKHIAHKIKGTAGTIDFTALATIALAIETLAGQATSGSIEAHTGVQALAQALNALEATLHSIAGSGEESSRPLAELEVALQALEIDLTRQQRAGISSDTSSQPAFAAPALPDAVARVDGRRLQELLLYSEQLLASSTTLEDAQIAVERAIQELQVAQERLRRLEASFSAHFLTGMSNEARKRSREERPASSLVARILDEALERTGHPHTHKHLQAAQPVPVPVPAQDAFPWDELEIDRFKGDALLAHSLGEAIADVATATSQLRVAYAQLARILRQRSAQITKVRDNALLLRVLPGEALRQPRSQGVVRALFLRVGSYTMAVPLSQVQRASPLSQSQAFPHEGEAAEIYTLSLLLGLRPQPQGIEPLSPTFAAASNPKSPVYLLLSQDKQGKLRGQDQQKLQIVEIDEILGDAEMIVRPLAAHLRRPGIAGSAIDGVGNVLLVLDLPELIENHQRHHYSLKDSSPRFKEATLRYAGYAGSDKQSILIADDSLYIRQSLRQTLLRSGYRVLEARDGVEAMDMLLRQRPAVLILDLEMPNLNGYEVLNLIRREPALASLQIIMMTARSSEKHYQRAGELGAHAYLTKPSAPEILLETVEDLLAGEGGAS